MRDGVFDGFGDGDAEGARGVGGLLDYFSAVLGVLCGGGVDLGAPGVHERAAVGFLVVGDFDHVNGALDAEHLAGHGEGGTPLSGAGFGGESFDAGLFVVVGLSDGGVGFVGAGRAGTFVFVVDVGGCVEGLFESYGAAEGRGTPEGVDLADFFGDRDSAFLRDFLFDDAHGEDGGEVLWAAGLLGAGVQRRGERGRQVGEDVVPVGGDLGLRKRKQHRMLRKSCESMHIKGEVGRRAIVFDRPCCTETDSTEMGNRVFGTIRRLGHMEHVEHER